MTTHRNGDSDSARRLVEPARLTAVDAAAVGGFLSGASPLPEPAVNRSSSPSPSGFDSPTRLPFVLPTPRVVIVEMTSTQQTQVGLLAIATADRLAALTARSGAVAAVDPTCVRIRAGRGSRSSGAFPLDGLVTHARRGSVSIVATDDGPVAAAMAAGRVPLVCIAAADERLAELVSIVSPTALVLVADDDTSGAYLALARNDLAAVARTADVIAARVSRRPLDLPDHELGLVVDAHGENKLRWGLGLSGELARSADRLARVIVDRPTQAPQ
ncbi:MAG: hypothetical protein WAP35_07040 [Solirubrobacterales bacterium]